MKEELKELRKKYIDERYEIEKQIEELGSTKKDLELIKTVMGLLKHKQYVCMIERGLS